MNQTGFRFSHLDFRLWGSVVHLVYKASNPERLIALGYLNAAQLSRNGITQWRERTISCLRRSCYLMKQGGSADDRNITIMGSPSSRMAGLFGVNIYTHVVSFSLLPQLLAHNMCSYHRSSTSSGNYLEGTRERLDLSTLRHRYCWSKHLSDEDKLE